MGSYWAQIRIRLESEGNYGVIIGQILMEYWRDLK